MDNYLLDREILEKVVDELIRKTGLPINNPEELNQLREKNIKKLDDEVTSAIFGSMEESDLIKMNEMLENENETPESYEGFFKNIGMDVEKIITNTMQNFSLNFLGGTNG